MKAMLSRTLAAVLIELCSPGSSFSAEAEEVSIWRVEVAPTEPGKYGIKGSVFGIGDPVHETLTKEALQRGGFSDAPISRSNVGAVQVLRGVFWNDDPCGQLFAEDEFNPLRPSFGVAWYLDFQAAKELSAQSGPASNDFRSLNCQLLGRSHFGDLQFLHAMANSNGLPARETADLVVSWMTFMYRIAIGGIDAKVSQKGLAGTESLPGVVTETTPMQLLLSKSTEEVRLRALGAMLHTMQDSFAHGHVTRKRDPSGVDQFLCYAGQSEKKHAHDDAWGAGTSDLQKTLAVPGALEALEASTKLVELFRNRTDWRTVKLYLESGPLKLRDGALSSGPGEYKQ